jgi:hypothetical protein
MVLARLRSFIGFISMGGDVMDKITDEEIEYYTDELNESLQQKSEGILGAYHSEYFEDIGRKLIAHHQATKNMQWISVEDELPEKLGDYSVWVTFSNGGVEDMRMVHVEDWMRDNAHDDLHVTHWQPLPTPPSEDK